MVPNSAIAIGWRSHFVIARARPSADLTSRNDCARCPAAIGASTRLVVPSVYTAADARRTASRYASSALKWRPPTSHVSNPWRDSRIRELSRCCSSRCCCPNGEKLPLYEALRGGATVRTSGAPRTTDSGLDCDLAAGGFLNSAGNLRGDLPLNTGSRRLDDRRIEIRGDAASSAAYLVELGRMTRRAKGSVFFVEGRTVRGRLDGRHPGRTRRGCTQVNVFAPGRFRVALQVQEPGALRRGLGEQSTARALRANQPSRRYGWLPPAPSSPHVVVSVTIDR